MKFFTLTIITGIIVWPVIGSAELYKWTDDQGNLHITDAPPRELQKRKAGPPLKPSSQSAQPMKASPSSTPPERSRSEVRPLQEALFTADSAEDTTHLAMVGLKSQQATFTSAWQTFDGARSLAKAPVQRWKDQRGIDHFVDVLPMAINSAERGATASKPRLKKR